MGDKLRAKAKAIAISRPVDPFFGSKCSGGIADDPGTPAQRMVSLSALLWLDIHALHAAFGVASAGGGADRDHLTDRLGLFRRQADIERAEIFLQPLDTLRAGD